MGIRSKIKGRIKSALGMPVDEGGEPSPPAAPSKHSTSISIDTGGGNLRGDKDVPWYLQYDDNDGWESTDAKPDIDDE